MARKADKPKPDVKVDRTQKKPRAGRNFRQVPWELDAWTGETVSSCDQWNWSRGKIR
jgi:hypothetical protein